MLKGLCDYYQCLTARENSPLVKEGYSSLAVGFRLVLKQDGTLKEILPHTRTVLVKGKEKLVPKEEMFPFRYSVSATASEFIEHREKYIFGLDYNKKEKKLQQTKTSLKSFQVHKEKFLLDFAEKHSPLIDAYRLFLEQWEPEQQLENPVLTALGGDFASAKFVIALEYQDNFLHKESLVLETWEKIYFKPKEQEGLVGTCSITGNRDSIPLTHTKLKVAGGMTTGVGLVSFNKTAFESYEKNQSQNSFVGETAMKQYTTAFNYLSTNPENRFFLDDSTYLFWANTENDEAPILNAFSLALGISSQQENKKTDEVEESIYGLYQRIQQGLSGDESAILKEYDKTEFHIMGVKPNVSRLSVKFYAVNTFGTMLERLNQHQLDMAFHEKDKPIALWQLRSALKSPVASEALPPDLDAKLFHSIILGHPYPSFLLQQTIKRVKTDQDTRKGKNGAKTDFYSVSPLRVRIIKGCLIRRQIIEREAYAMLNEENKEKAYLCGRLFAVLEQLQQKAVGEVNASVKDRYFSSACTTPALVFPRLLKLSQSHLSKVGKDNKGLAVNIDKKMQELIAQLDDGFPKSQGMEKQGVFILGYYQQREVNYTKSTKKEGNDHE